jgi:hypothetical protein
MTNHFDPPDWTYLRFRANLSPGQRLAALLDARELAVGLMRGRLRRQYPMLSIEAINLKLLEEIERAKQTRSRF